MDDEFKDNERLQLNALLDLDTPYRASDALKSRIHAISASAQIQPVLVFWSLRNLKAYTALFAFIAVIGAWAGRGPLGAIMHVDDQIDAMLVSTMLGPVNNHLGDVL